jgi:flavin reductase (DIM6/NTAB) family NADH-FMN oxidoreductase RutF
LRPLEEIVLASWVKRDTLNNIRATKDFVVNVPSIGMIEKVMVCARNYPPEVDEFVESGLKPRRSSKVKSPGVQGCLAWAECVLVEEIERKNYSLVVGKVVHLEVEEPFFNEDGEMDYELARPLSAILGSRGMWFTRPVFAGRYAGYAEMFAGGGNASK